MVNQVPYYARGYGPYYTKQVKGVVARPATVAEMQEGYKNGNRLGHPTGVPDPNGHLPRSINGQQLTLVTTYRNSSVGSSSSAASLSGNKRSRSGAVIKH
jgi:hypothetical protein